MPVKATINGEVWEFDTPAEAAEFKRSITERPVPPGGGGARPKRRGRPSSRAARSGASKRAVAAGAGAGKHSGLTAGSRQILDAIRRAPNTGLVSEDFARAIGSPSPASVPLRMMLLGKQLKALGINPEEAILRDRIYVKGRARSIFKPGPRLDDALRHNGELFGAGR